jgi:hypothetical protein
MNQNEGLKDKNNCPLHPEFVPPGQRLPGYRLFDFLRTAMLLAELDIFIHRLGIRRHPIANVLVLLAANKISKWFASKKTPGVIRTQNKRWRITSTERSSAASRPQLGKHHRNYSNLPHL